MADSQTREQALGRAWKAARQTDALASPMLAEVVCAIPACFDLLEIEALPRAFRGDSVIPAAPIRLCWRMKQILQPISSPPERAVVTVVIADEWPVKREEAGRLTPGTFPAARHRCAPD